MNLLDKLKSIFNDKKEEQKKYEEIINNIFNKEKPSEKNFQEEFDIVLNDIDKCALYFKNREKPFVLIKDKNFPFLLNNPDLEFIEMNKQNFEYYGEFDRLEILNEKILNIEKQEELDRKTENDYLIDYLEHSKSDYSKVIKKMETFEIDKVQYDKLIDSIKLQIKQSVKDMYKNHTNANPMLQTDRSYKDIMDKLMDFKSFTNKFPYKYYSEFRDDEVSISHCGYPDYMWQSGAEGNFIHLAKIPNSTNWIFEYNQYIGGSEADDYIVKFAIISDKEKETILKHWDDFQERNEINFEKEYMECLARKIEKEQQSEEDEEVM